MLELHAKLDLALLAIFALLAWIVGQLGRTRRLAPLLSRSCAGRRWRREFPGAGKMEIREFLGIFVDAFGFPRQKILAFRPEDRIMDVYHAVYPSGGVPDELELESFDL